MVKAILTSEKTREISKAIKLANKDMVMHTKEFETELQHLQESNTKAKKERVRIKKGL